MNQEYNQIKNRVYIRCIRGCIQRNLDAKKIGIYLSKNNYTIIEEPTDADYIIFFSCGATDTQIKCSLNDIKRFQKYNAELIVSGCVPDIAPEKLQKIFSGHTISPKKLDQIDELFPNNRTKLNEIDEQHSKWLSISYTEGIGRYIELIKKITVKIPISKKFFIFTKNHILKPFFCETVLRTTPRDVGYIISISRGCIHKCSYCGIRKGIGTLKSKSVNQCITEFREGLHKGNKHFVITADDIGPYGIDIGSSLPELLDKITNIPGEYTIKITGTNPQWIIKYIHELVPIFQRGNINRFVLCVQSGNDRILTLMRRYYNRDALISAVSRLKLANPNLKIDVHFIIGFPSETWEEFLDSISLIESVRFTSGNIFQYIPVDGTDATIIKPQISKKEIIKRSRYAVKILQKNNYTAIYDRAFHHITFREKF